MPAFQKGNTFGFKPGQSGNPAGRPNRTKEWKDRLQRFMTEEGGMDELLAIARGERDPKDQLKALQFCAEQVHGKANQSISGPDPEDEAHPPLLLQFVNRSSGEGEADSRSAPTAVEEGEDVDVGDSIAQ